MQNGVNRLQHWNPSLDQMVHICDFLHESAKSFLTYSSIHCIFYSSSSIDMFVQNHSLAYYNFFFSLSQFIWLNKILHNGVKLLIFDFSSFLWHFFTLLPLIPSWLPPINTKSNPNQFVLLFHFKFRSSSYFTLFK